MPAHHAFAKLPLINLSQLALRLTRTLLLVLTCVGAWSGSVQAADPSVTTDKTDYAPGSTADITGAGFQANETVEVQVFNLTNPTDIGTEHDPWSVTADDNGNFQTTWYVTEDEANTTLLLAATGQTSGLTAQMTFTDNSALTAAAGGTSISADTAGGTSWTTLTGPTIAEGAAGEVSIGPIVINAPSGFEFNTAAAVTAKITVGSATATDNINDLAVNSTIAAVVTSSKVTINVGIKSSGAGHKNTLLWQNIQVRPTAGTPLASGNMTLTATITGITSGAQCGTLTEVVGAASKLAFTTNPGGTLTGGTAFGTQPVVKVQDQFGNTASSSAAIALAITTGTPTSGGPGTLSGTTPMAAAGGVATFSGLSINKAGTAYKLTASSSGLAAVDSTAFSITAGAATRLAYTTVPSTGTAGTAFSVTVQSQDAGGNPASPSANTLITLSKASGTGTLSGTLTGTILASGNSVTLSTPVYSAADTMTLTSTRTSGGNALTAVTSGNIVFSSGAVNATHSTISPGTAAITADGSSTQVITVQARDANNNNLTTGGSTVVISKPSGSGSVGGTTDNDNGTYTATVTSPTATGSGTFVATLGGTAVGTAVGASSSVVTYAAGPLDHFAISTIPSPKTAGSAITGIAMTAQDVNNNTVTSFVSAVTYSGTAGITGTSAAFTAGQLTGVSVTPTTAGNSKMFIVTGSAKTGASTFDVNPGAAAKLAYTTAPGTGTAGTPISMTVQSQDANGNAANLASATTITLSKAAGTGTLSGTLTGSIGSGTNSVTISTPVYSKADTLTLTATASGGVTLTPVTSGNIVFTAGAASQLAFATQPATAVHNATITPAVTVRIEDPYGNLVNSSANVTMGIGNNPAGGTLAGTQTVAASAGTATFSTLSINNAGIGYTLAASSGSLTADTSSAFDITGVAITQAASGLWSATTTWTGGVVPVAGDTVTIGVATTTVTVDISNAACASLAMGVNGGVTLKFAASGSPKLTVSGAITVGNSGNINRAGTITFTSGSTLECGSLIHGAIAAQVSTLTMTAGGTLIVNGAITTSGAGAVWTPGVGGVELTANKSLPTAIFTSFHDLTISGGTTTMGVGLTVGGNLSIADGATFASASTYTLGVTGTTTVGGGTSGTLTLAGTGAKTFSGNVTVNDGGVWNETGASTYTFGGNLQNDGAFTANTGVHTFSGTAKALSGTSAIVIPNMALSGTYQNNGTLTINAFSTGAGTLTQGASAILNIAASSVTPTLAASGNGNSVNYTGGIQTVKPTTYSNLTLSGSSAKTTTSVTVTGILSMGGTATATTALTYGSAATLQYNGSGAQTTGVEFPATWGGSGGVIIANTSGNAVTLGGAKVINATLTIATGAILNTSAAGNYGVTFGGDFVNDGTFTANASPITIAGLAATQSIDGFITTGLTSITKTGGTAMFLGNVNGGAITLNGSGGTLDLGSGLTHIFTGAITFTAGTLNGGSSTAKIGGSPSGAGVTFVAGTSTIEWTSASAQSIASVTYYNLTTSGGSIKTATGNTVVNGVLKIQDYLNMGGYQLSGAFTTASGGVLQTSNTSSTPLPAGKTWNVKVNYLSGGPSTLVGGTYQGSSPSLQIQNNNAANIAAGDITIASGFLSLRGTSGLNMSGYNLTFSSDQGGITLESSAATFIAGSGTVTYDRSGNQTIWTTTPITYNNLALTGSGLKTVPAGTVVSGNLSINGSQASVAADSNIGVGTLTLGGAGRNNSTWGSTLSSATHTDDTYFAATTGTVTVTTDTRATPTATLAVNNSPQTYSGTAKAATIQIATSSVPGSAANILTGGATGQTGAGTYAVTADFVPTDSTNYKTLTHQSAGNFVIQKKALTIGAPTLAAKTYNASATAGAVTVGTLAGVVGSETVTATATAADYASANAGTHTGVVVTYTLANGSTGGLAANYSVANESASGVITPKAIDITAVTASKPADGDTSSTGTPTLSPGLAAGDTSGFIQTFDNAAAGTGKTLTPSGAVNDGNSGNNYSVTLHSVTTGTITAGAATQVRVESAADGTGTAVAAQNVTAGSPLTVYAITRDAYDNFVANPSASWSLQGRSGGVVNGDLAGGGASAVFTGHLVGSATIQAVAAGSTGQSGVQTVVAGALDHFAVSDLASLQTAGTAIAGITLTAQDIYGNPVTGFSGDGNTVTYSGTAGITGTSENFASGVLSGVSVTPTVSGTNKTLVVTGGYPSKTGSATIALILNARYGTWIADYPTLSGADTLPEADPDHDGVINMVEYAFGTDPTSGSSGPDQLAYTDPASGSPDPAPLATTSGYTLTKRGSPTFSDTGPGSPMVFGRRKDYVAAGLTYKVQFSAAGKLQWVDGKVAPSDTPLATDGTIDAVSVPFPMFIITLRGAEKATFFRVGVSMAP
ncbi:MAG: invasin domain 3-containing protein [Verrucomicrobiota bacterium]